MAILLTQDCATVSRKSLLLYFLLSPAFLPSYLITRLKMHALSSSYPDYPRESIQRRWWALLDQLESFGRWFELAGWITFLYDGK
jgi:peroxin-2